MMDAGSLNRRIVFQQWDEETETWKETPCYRCSAFINGLSGSEYWAASAVQAENTVDFTVRYCRKISEMCPQYYRILFRGSFYDIQTLDNIRFEDKYVKIRAVRKNG